MVKTLEFQGERNSGGEVAEFVKCVTMNEAKSAKRNLLEGGELLRTRPKGNGLWEVKEVEQQAV